jgi:hypothetical protein
MRLTIPKADLIDGAYYQGSCRNATVARWSAKDERFYYWRFKFGDRFVEDIRHPEDDDGHDVFHPYSYRLAPGDVHSQIPLEIPTEKPKGINDGNRSIKRSHRAEGNNFID